MLGLLLLAFASTSRALLDTRLRDEMETAIAKRVARDSAGNFYVLTLPRAADGSRHLCLRRGPPAAAHLADFAPASDPAGAVGWAPSVRSAGLAIDSNDRLHLIWTGENGASAYAITPTDGSLAAWQPRWTDPASGRPGAMVLAARGSLVGDITAGPDGQVGVAWLELGADHQAAVHLGCRRQGRWSEQSIAAGYGFFPPTLVCGKGGTYYSAWNDIYEDDWLLSGRWDRPATAPLPKPWSISGSARDRIGGYRPIVALPAAGPLVVRESQYNQLEYFPQPALDRHPLNLTRNDHRFAWDTVHSPQFFTDRFGIEWLFFIDSARQHLFYTRWLGSTWSEFHDAGQLTWNSARFEDNHLPIDRFSVEERSSNRSNDIGVLLENDSTTPTAKFTRLALPRIQAEPGRKILFLDLQDVARVEGVAMELNRPRKCGPVISAGAPGDFDADRVGRFVRVLKEAGKYRMWYVAMKIDPREAWWDWDRMGYAESGDGLQFHRVDLGLAPFGSKTNTNLVPGLARTMGALCFDPSDPDPEQRYKALDLPNTGVENGEAHAGRQDPWDGDRLQGRLLTSPDGLRWRAVPAVIDFPAGRPGELVPEAIFRDEAEPDPRKRFKAYGFSSLNLRRRGPGYAYSADARHWTADPDNPVLDPFVGATPPVRGGMVEQIHDLMVWPDGGYYLALYEYQIDGGNLDLRLALSRDGEHFDFVRPEEAWLPAGGVRDWDRGMLTPAVPVADGDQLKIYYGGTYYNARGGHDEAPALAQSYGGLGVATLRRDGFTDLVAAQAGSGASFTTLPVEAGRAAALTVNADCGSGALLVSLIDPGTGRAIPGFGATDATPVTGDAMAWPVRWKAAPSLAALHRPFQIRVDFQPGRDSPKLYSLSFR